MDEELKEKQLSSEQLFEGKVIRLFLDEVRLPDGKTAQREYLRHPGGACILPLDEDGNVTCVRQYRYPHAQVLTELPAGKLNGRGTEDIRAAAIRELREETGYQCEKLTYLGKFLPSPAILDEVIYFFMAEGLTTGETQYDDDEFLIDRKIPLSELVEQVLSGELIDGKTQALVMRAWEMLRRRELNK